MRKLTLLILLLPIISFAQPLGNEWINLNQDYFKITVPGDGIYKVTYADLQAVGFPLATVDPAYLQLFRRGVEVAINFAGQDDRTFDSSDYFEFYGQKNDGKLDEQLYVNASDQPHQYYSLYADSSAYFLTYNISAPPGKRMNENLPFTGAPIETSVLREQLYVYSNEYAKGYTESQYATLTQFVQGEAFTGTRITEISRPTFDLTLDNLTTPDLAAPNPSLQLQILGRNVENHEIEVYAGPDSGALISLGIYSFSDFNSLIINQNFDWSLISAGGELVVRIEVKDNGGNQSNLSLSYAKISYAKLPNVNNQDYFVASNRIKAGSAAILFQNVPATSFVYNITDSQNVSIEADTDLDGTTITVGLPDASTSHKLVIATATSAFSLKPIDFRPINPSANYLIISHKSLMQPAGNHNDAVKAYASYRATNGGGFDTLIVDIDLLYNQFSYGQPTPLALYNFMRYMTSLGDPEYLLLIGKSLHLNYKYYRDPQRAALNGYQDLVPTAGYPGSDLVYTVGLGSDPNLYAVPTGRLSVSTPEEIINYLNKVVEMETAPYDALWRKKLLHLSGGNSQFELSRFKYYVDDLKNKAEGYFFGGEAATISKTNTAPDEFIDVTDEVNAGVNIITFFGHSAPDVIDIDIGKVSNPALGYNNKGKYPTLLMNGCQTGDVFIPNTVFIEDWISAAEKGSIAGVAHFSYGFPNLLKQWSDNFYNLGYSDSVFMELSIGEIMKEATRQFLDSLGSDFNYLNLTQAQQMGLLGDPAVKLFGTYTPDYEITENNIEFVSLTNRGITSEADSFGIAIGVKNYGAYIADSLEVQVKRTLPNDSIIIYTETFRPVRHFDTLLFVIDNRYEGNAGFNDFEIIIDPQNMIKEHNEFNNFVSITNKKIPSSGPLNLIPYPFAIQSSPILDLILQSGNTLAEERSYLAEIDSLPQFNSMALKQSPPLSGKGGIIWQNQQVEASDTTAFYWRSKYQSPLPSEVDIWTNSTFTYIAGGQPGWAQVAFDQTITNTLSGLTVDSTAKKIKFLETELPIEITVHAANSVDFTYKDTELKIDGLPFILEPSYSLCYNNRLNIVAFNKENAAPYAPILGNQIEQWTCGRSPQVINSFDGGKALDEILDAIAVGDKVLLFTTGSFDFNTLSATNIAKLEELGVNPLVIGAKAPAEPYIMLGYKGAGSGNSTAEIIADPALPMPTTGQTISYNGIIKGIYNKGSITSSSIGPATSWDQLSVKMVNLDASDQYAVDLYGKTLNNTSSLLLSNIQSFPYDLSSIIDANDYPYINLSLRINDDVNQTAPQLQNWIVNYQPVAEGLVAYSGNSEGSAVPITVAEGKKVLTRLSFTNISQYPFSSDSLLVRTVIFNVDQRSSSDAMDTLIVAPLPGDSVVFEIPIDTKGWVGVNRLSVDVNPGIVPEQYYLNNSISIDEYLRVERESSNPELEVSFDGEFIFDGDIVSPNPNIHIIIRDQNEYLLKTDTTGIDILLKPPCENCFAARIPLSGNSILWTPETEDEPFTIDFNPTNLEDGIYELSVQVTDASGNKSGTEPYLIHFEVINKSTVTNFYPYPNPFSTSVKFIFTLTGNEVPDQLMIRIFTVSGRVIREITLDELGPIKIGNNVSDYAWNGRDEFGDQLANGVYLYKVFIKRNGQDVEIRESGGDRGFKNGYGKLYLLR